MVHLGHGLGFGMPLGVGVHHAGHVLPNGHRLGTNRHSQEGRAVVRPFSPKGRRPAAVVPSDEPLGDDHLRRCQRLAKRRPCVPQSGFVHPRVPVRSGSAHRLAHVPPYRVQPLGRTPSRHQGGAGQFPGRHKRIVRGFGEAVVLGRLGFLPRRLERALEPIGHVEAKFRRHVKVRLHNVVPTSFLLGASSAPHLFQGVGGFSHRRNHHHSLFLGAQVVRQKLTHPADGRGVLHRGAAKLVGGTWDVLNHALQSWMARATSPNLRRSIGR